VSHGRSRELQGEPWSEGAAALTQRRQSALDPSEVTLPRQLDDTAAGATGLCGKSEQKDSKVS
jgi:hypothetical protein